MAETHMLYDFEAALKTLINAQADIMTLVQKWGEMIASDPHDVTFSLKGPGGQATDYIIPNIQKVIDTLNARSLPPDPTFNSVATVARYGGRAKLTAGRLEFTGANVGTAYDSYGIDGLMWSVPGDTTLTHWPIRRYWLVTTGTSYSVTIRPALEIQDGMRATDFFVCIPAGSSIELTFHSYGQSRTRKLTAGSQFEVWHIFASAVRTQSGLDVTARFAKMEG